MKRHPPTTSHNYLAALERFGATLSPEIRAMNPVPVDVNHDAWCDFLTGRGFCNCDVTLKLKLCESEFETRTRIHTCGLVLGHPGDLHSCRCDEPATWSDNPMGPAASRFIH